MTTTYLHADLCGCPEPKSPETHVPGEPSDDICLISPIDSTTSTGHDDPTIELVARALFAWDTEEHPDPAPTWEALAEEQRDVWRSGARVAMAAGAPALLAAERRTKQRDVALSALAAVTARVGELKTEAEWAEGVRSSIEGEPSIRRDVPLPAPPTERSSS